MVDIPGFDAPGAAHRFDGVRGARPGTAGTGRADRRSSADAAGEAAEGDQPDLSAVARRHLREGASRLHDVGAFAPITDADAARAAARDLGRRLREQPQQAERAQANLTAAIAQRALG